MKCRKLQITSVAALFLTAVALLAQDAAIKEPEELTRLRQGYNQRRDIALKPITASYEQQLELLLKNLTQRTQLDAAIAVRKELESVRADGQAEVRSALFQWKWSWMGKGTENDTFLSFREDGTVSHRGMHGTWSLTGPREVKLIEDRGRTLLFSFNANLDSYRCISGARDLYGRRAAK